MIGHWDRNLRNSFGNLAYAQWFDIAPDALPGMHLRDVIGAERYRINLPYIEAALAGEEQRFEVSAFTAEGGLSWNALVQYIPDSSAGQVQGVYIVVSDISAVKETEAALRKSEHLLRESQEGARIGSYSSSINDGTFEATPVLDDIFGITKDYPHTTEGWVKFMHPDSMQALTDALQDSIRDRTPFDSEYKIIRPSDGAERWMHGLGKITYDSQGNAQNLIGTVQDITELKRIQEELIDSERSYRTLTDGAPASLLVHDGKQIVYVNTAAIRMLGASSATELLGTEMFRLVHPAFRSASRRGARLSISQADSLTMSEYKILKLDGSTAVVEVQSAAVMFDGKPAVQLIMNDVTELRHFAKRQLDAIENERKSISREVHDQVGQAFTAVKLLVQSLPQGVLPKELGLAITEALEMGIAATRKITAELRPRLLDDLGLAAALKHLADQMLGVLQLNVEIDVGDEQVLDASRRLGLFRIAQETLTNVVKHAAAKHVTMSGRRGTNRYVFRMEDDGQGFKRRNTRSDAMGLISMQERAQAMGGHCIIESNLNRGTLVEVVLPLNGDHDHEHTAA